MFERDFPNFRGVASLPASLYLRTEIGQRPETRTGLTRDRRAERAVLRDGEEEG